MAKKPARGGRVTAKGTRPTDGKGTQSKSQPAIDHRVVNRFDPASQQRGGAAHAPTRAGHHRGNR